MHFLIYTYSINNQLLNIKEIPTNLMGLKRFINENDKNVKIALCYFKGDTSVDLSVKSEENVEYMVEAIKEKLRMVNAGAMRAASFNEEMYEDLRDIYDHVMKRETFSISEMQAITEELGTLIKSKKPLLYEALFTSNKFMTTHLFPSTNCKILYNRSRTSS